MEIYSLANYKLTLTSDDPTIIATFGESISIGGQGKKIGSISINQTNSPYALKSFETGGYYYDKTLDRSGTITISLNQLAEEVAKFKTLLNLYYTGDYNGFTAVLTTNENVKVAECIDCLMTNVPNQSFGGSTGSQEWQFGTGQITFS